MRIAMRAAGALLVAQVALSACSGSDDSDDNGGADPDATPTAAAPTSSAGPDVQADVEEAIAAYDRALVGFYRSQEVTPGLAAVATEEWAQRLLTTFEDNVFSNGLEMVGRWRTSVASVSISGDTARARVCSDGSKVYVVESGGGIPSGTPSQGRSAGVISLVLVDGGWRVDGNESTEAAC